MLTYEKVLDLTYLYCWHERIIMYRDIFYIQRDGGKNSMIIFSMGTSKVRKSLQFVPCNRPHLIL